MRTPTVNMVSEEEPSIQVRVTSRPDENLDTWLDYRRATESTADDADAWPCTLEWPVQDDLTKTLQDVAETLCVLTHASRGGERKLAYINDWFVAQDLRLMCETQARDATIANERKMRETFGAKSTQAKAAKTMRLGCQNKTPQLYGNLCPSTVADVFFAIQKLERKLHELSFERATSSEARSVRSHIHVSLLKKLLMFELRHDIGNCKVCRVRSDAVRQAFDEVTHAHIEWRRDPATHENLRETIARETIRAARAELDVIERSRR